MRGLSLVIHVRFDRRKWPVENAGRKWREVTFCEGEAARLTGREGVGPSKGIFLLATAWRLLPSRREVRPTMALEYRERSTLGTGWALEVCSSGVLVGHIQFGAGNLFRYYEGTPRIGLTPQLSDLDDLDLEALRRKIEDHHRRR